MKFSEDGIPKYCQLQEAIYRRIKDGRLKLGDRLDGERELARQFNVSHMTVRHGIEKLVKAGVLCRQHGKGTFVANVRKASPSGPDGRMKNKPVSVLLPGPQGRSETPAPYIKRGVLEAVHDTMSPLDIPVNIMYFPPDGKACQGLKKCLENESGGVVFWHTDTPQNIFMIDELLEHGVPVVLVNNYSERPYDYVVADNRRGAWEMTRHLAELGHSRIAYLTGNEDSTSVDERRAGFLEAVGDFGLSGSKAVEMQIPFSESSIMDAVKMALGRRFSAIFAYNDLLAIKVLRSLRSLNARIPDDVSLAGYDNIDMVDLLSPPLSTVSQDFYRMGLEAAAILLGRMNAGEAVGKESRQMRVMPELIVRGSTSRVRESAVR